MSYKLFLLFLILLALPLPALAASLDGSFYNSAEIYYGDIKFTGGQGEYISELYNYSANSVRLDGLELNASLKNNTTVNVVFQVSNDAFSSIKDSATLSVSEGKRKYYMPDALKGSYARYIIRGEGHATITPKPLEHNKQIIRPLEIPKPLVMFLALLAGVMVMLGYDKVKEKLATNSKGLFLAILVGFFFMFSSLGAATMSISTADGSRTPSTTFDIGGQETGLKHYVEVKGKSGDWQVVKEFTTSAEGNYRFTKELDFSQYLINETNGRYRFRLRRNYDDAITESESFSYGLMTDTKDWFDDYSDPDLDMVYGYNHLFDNPSFSTNNELIVSYDSSSGLTYFYLNQSSFSYSEHFIKDVRVDQGSNYDLGGGPIIITESGDTYTFKDWDRIESKKTLGDYHIYYNQSSNKYTVNRSGSISTTATTVFEPFKVGFHSKDYVSSDGNSVTYWIDSWRQTDVRPLNYDAGQLVEWQSVDADVNTPKNIRYYALGNEYLYFDDVPDSSELDVRIETVDESGDIDYYKVYYEPVNYLDLIAPEDGTTFETFDDIDSFKFNYQLPDNYKEGYLSFKIDGTKIGGMGDYTSDLDGSCVVTESVNGTLEALLTDACINHTIAIDVPITGEPGIANWSVVYDASVVKEDGSLIDASDANKTKTTIESNTRTFRVLQSSVSVYPYYPLNNSIVTTTKPTFAFNVHSSIASTFNVYIDGNRQYSLDLEGREGYKGYEEFTPFSGLSEGSHTYYAEIVKDDGELLANTSTRSFDVNLSIADIYSIDLLAPEDEATTRDKEQEFSYKLNVSDPGFTRLYLNKDQIHGVSVDSQLATKNVTATLTPESYFWYATYEPDALNATITSEQRRLVMFSNVSVTAVKPEDDADIIEPPLTFKGQLKTNVDGVIRLLIDGDAREHKTITANYDGDVSFTIDANLSEGKHTWTLMYEGGYLDVPYESETRTFTLAKAAPEEGVFTGGSLGQAALAFKGLFGVDAAGALAFTALLISLAFTIAVGTLVNDGMVAGITLVGSLLAFSIMDWLPRWVVLVLVIIAGYLLASKVAEG